MIIILLAVAVVVIVLAIIGFILTKKNDAIVFIDTESSDAIKGLEELYKSLAKGNHQ